MRARRAGSRKLLGLAAVVALIGAAALAQAADTMPAPPPGPHPAMMMRHGGPGMSGMPGMLPERLLNSVGASAEQKTRIHAILRAAHDDVEKQHAAQRELHQQLAAALAAPQLDAAGAEALRQKLNAGHDAEAFALLKQQQGGVEGAIQGARSASELMAIRDIALKGGDQAAANSAYERVVESFPGDQNAPLAAYQLGMSYKLGGQSDRARKYFEQYLGLSPSGAFAEGALCSLVTIAAGSGNKDEALRRSKEYLARYPNGQCKAVEREHEGSGDDAPSLPAAPTALPAAPSALPSAAPVAP